MQNSGLWFTRIMSYDIDMACIITQYGSTVYIGMAMGGSAL